MQVGPDNKVCVFGRRAESKVDTDQHQPHGVSCGMAKTVGMRTAVTLVPERWQPKAAVSSLLGLRQESCTGNMMTVFILGRFLDCVEADGSRPEVPGLKSAILVNCEK